MSVTSQTLTSSFRRNALLMIIGTAMAQGLVFGALLVFARIFPAQTVGIQAVYVSLAGILVTIASLRLDLALVLEPDDDEAVRVGTVAIAQGVAVALLVSLGVVLWGDAVAEFFAPTVEPSTWLFLLPIGTVVGVLLQVGMAHANRVGRFTALMSSDVLAACGFAVAGLVLWATWDAAQSLALARQLGQVASVGLLIALGVFAWRKSSMRLSAADVTSVWSTHRQFVVFNTPYSAVGAFARDLPILVFAATGGVVATAAYALARTITVAPVVLFSSALSRAFYKEAVDQFGTERLRQTVTRLTRIGLFVGLVPFAWLSSWGDVALAFLLGDRWLMAGQMSMLLAPAVWMSLQTGWPERMFEVTRRQGVSFSIQVSFDMLHIAVLGLLFLTTGNVLVAVAGFASSLFAFHVVYLLAVFGVAGYARLPLVRDLGIAVATYGALALMLWVVRGWFGPSVGAALTCAGVVAVLSVIAMWFTVQGRALGLRSSR